MENRVQLIRNSDTGRLVKSTSKLGKQIIEKQKLMMSGGGGPGFERPIYLFDMDKFDIVITDPLKEGSNKSERITLHKQNIRAGSFSIENRQDPESPTSIADPRYPIEIFADQQKTAEPITITEGLMQKEHINYVIQIWTQYPNMPPESVKQNGRIIFKIKKLLNVDLIDADIGFDHMIYDTPSGEYKNNEGKESTCYIFKIETPETNCDFLTKNDGKKKIDNSHDQPCYRYELNDKGLEFNVRARLTLLIAFITEAKSLTTRDQVEAAFHDIIINISKRFNIPTSDTIISDITDFDQFNALLKNNQSISRLNEMLKSDEETKISLELKPTPTEPTSTEPTSTEPTSTEPTSTGNESESKVIKFLDGLDLTADLNEKSIETLRQDEHFHIPKSLKIYENTKDEKLSLLVFNNSGGPLKYFYQIDDSSSNERSSIELDSDSEDLQPHELSEEELQHLNDTYADGARITDVLSKQLTEYSVSNPDSELNEYEIKHMADEGIRISLTIQDIRYGKKYYEIIHDKTPEITHPDNQNQFLECVILGYRFFDNTEQRIQNFESLGSIEIYKPCSLTTAIFKITNSKMYVFLKYSTRSSSSDHFYFTMVDTNIKDILNDDKLELVVLSDAKIRILEILDPRFAIVQGDELFKKCEKYLQQIKNAGKLNIEYNTAEEIKNRLETYKNKIQQKLSSLNANIKSQAEKAIEEFNFFIKFLDKVIIAKEGLSSKDFLELIKYYNEEIYSRLMASEQNSSDNERGSSDNERELLENKQLEKCRIFFTYTKGEGVLPYTYLTMHVVKDDSNEYLSKELVSSQINRLQLKFRKEKNELSNVFIISKLDHNQFRCIFYPVRLDVILDNPKLESSKIETELTKKLFVDYSI